MHSIVRTIVLGLLVATYATIIIISLLPELLVATMLAMAILHM